MAKHYCSVTLAQRTHRIELFKLLNLHLILNAFCLFENVVAMEFANMMVQVLWFLSSTFFKDNKLLKLQIYALLSHKTPLRLLRLFHFVSLTRPIKGNKISQFNNNKLLV